MERYLDILMERAEMVRNWRLYMTKIAEAARKILPDSRIYVFGSVVKGKATGGSDVDVLIVSGKMPRSNMERAEIKVRIVELSGLPLHHPFEIHLADEKEAGWYFSRIKELVEITDS